MMQKKVCLLGAFAVGKTSLVSRFVQSIFSEKYHTTIGVKIDRKVVSVGAQEWQLILWDLAGEDEFLQLRTSYVRGSSGYLLVVDGTRKATLDVALSLQQRVSAALGNIPFVIVFNKADLQSEWEMPQDLADDLSRRDWPWVMASAKTGAGVEEAFHMLVRHMQEV
jgi:small GTP-binding protein